MRRAVITGIGVVSPFGFGWRPFSSGLADGRSAIGPIRHFDASTFPVRVAGEAPLDAGVLDALKTFPGAGDLLEYVTGQGMARDRKALFAMIAAREAWESAGCGRDEKQACLSIALGLEQGLLEDFSSARVLRDEDYQREVGGELPATRFRTRADLGAECVSALLGLEGESWIHVSACAAGGLALAHAASLIERGTADVVISGGADSMVNPLGLGGMTRLGAPSPRNEPDACRPFDKKRDGLVIGEGAAIFVVENEERARARGAKLLARISGWGSTQDAFKATAPRPGGEPARRAMSRALERAKLTPERIGYVNAHGTGTPLNDPAEAAAIRAALGPATDRVPVSSIKGAIGHLMAASGAVEAAACLFAFERDLLPGTAHLKQIDPACPIDVIGPEPRRAHVDVILSNSFGFGGQNVSLALERAS